MQPHVAPHLVLNWMLLKNIYRFGSGFFIVSPSFPHMAVHHEQSIIRKTVKMKAKDVSLKAHWCQDSNAMDVSCTVLYTDRTANLSL